MKRIVSLLLVFAVFISMSCFAFAAEPDVTNDGVKMTILTKDQYITRLSEVKQISKDEAAKIVGKSVENVTDKSVNSLVAATSAGQYYAEFYYQENVGPGWAVEVGALCLVASGSGHSNFVSVKTDAIWSAAVGSGAHTWEPFYKDATIPNPSTLKLMTRGNLTVTITSSMSASVKSAFIDAGFSVSGNTYLRKAISISGYKYLY